MAPKFRHELKFICSEQELMLMENKVKCICRLDAHAGDEGIYNIRSVYFDSYDNMCFYENENGDNDRYKYRIRIYNYSDEVIKLERKATVSELKNKESCFLSKKQCLDILNGMEPEEVNSLLLARFLAERRINLLEPKVIVDYERTPYVYDIGNVRVTFDRNISSSSIIDLFNEDIPRRPILERGLNLIEVKYDEVLPVSIQELINTGHNMRRTAFSKYALCRQISLR